MYDSLKFIVMSFVLPPGGPVVLIALGVLLWRRRPGLAKGLCASAALLLWLASLPVVAAALVSALGGAAPLDRAEARSAQAIVVLGGGVRAQALEYGGDTLGRLTLERTRYAAHLANALGLPILVTGGTQDASVRPEADLMREAFAGEYGLRVRWVENRSRNTLENAANAARLLHADGVKRIVLVTHGFDARRARGHFEAAGLQVVSAPTQVPRWDLLRIGDFVPNAWALGTSHFALYELLALGRELLFR